MFQWTTTRIVNSLTDLTTNKPLITVANGKMHVKRSMTFDANYIQKVYVAPAQDPTKFELEINFAESTLLAALQGLASTATPTVGVSLSFYIGLEGSEQSVFANDWYRKGRQFSVGFDVTSSTTAADIVSQIVSNINNYRLNVLDGQLFNAAVKTGSGNTGVLVLSGNEEHQRIMNVQLTYDSGLYVNTLRYYADGATSNPNCFNLVNRGTNGFGTYYQLTKDLRLPTAQHTKAYKTLEDELPIPGAKYTQFIITYCAPSMANPAFTVLGQKENSETTHIFWVKSDVACDSANLANTFLGYLINASNDSTQPGLNLGTKVKQAGVAANGHASEVTVSASATSSSTYTAGTATYTYGTDAEPFTGDDTISQSAEA